MTLKDFAEKRGIKGKVIANRAGITKDIFYQIFRGDRAPTDSERQGIVVVLREMLNRPRLTHKDVWGG